MAKPVREMTDAQVQRAAQRALLRLQVRVTGEVHRLFGELQQWTINAGLRVLAADESEQTGALAAVQNAARERVDETVARYRRLMDRAREEAANLAFGVLLVQHNRLALAVDSQMPLSEREMSERVIGPQEVLTVVQLWQIRRNRVLQAAASRLYGDGFDLSGRIWQLAQDGHSAIAQAVMRAMTERTNAADLARLVEGYLGARQDCPRWTMTRLYRMTPADRMAEDRGLLRGEECRGQGVAYNALRLARNEIQIAHQRMMDEIFMHAPWVQGVYIRTSPGHAEEDICDEYANGGPYQPGEVALPLHVQCMCRQEAAVMDRAQFIAQARGYLRGENSFLDQYAGWGGVTMDVLPWTMGLAESLQLWLNNAPDAHAEALGV